MHINWTNIYQNYELMQIFFVSFVLVQLMRMLGTQIFVQTGYVFIWYNKNDYWYRHYQNYSNIITYLKYSQENINHIAIINYLKTKNLPPKLNLNLNARQREGKAFVDKFGKDFAVEKDPLKIITNLFLCFYFTHYAHIHRYRNGRSTAYMYTYTVYCIGIATHFYFCLFLFSM